MAKRRGISEGLASASQSIGAFLENALREKSVMKERAFSALLQGQLATQDDERAQSLARLQQKLMGEREQATNQQEFDLQKQRFANENPAYTSQQAASDSIADISKANTLEDLPTYEETFNRLPYRGAGAKGGSTHQMGTMPLEIPLQIQQALESRQNMLKGLKERVNPLSGVKEQTLPGDSSPIQLERTGEQEGLREADKLKQTEFNPDFQRQRVKQAGAVSGATSAGSTMGQMNSEYQNLDKVAAIAAAKRGPDQTGAGNAAGEANLETLADKILSITKRRNTATEGLQARGSGIMSGIKGAAGYDDDANELSRLTGALIPALARRVGHNGVLTQQDFESVAKIPPSIGLTASEQARAESVFKSLTRAAIRNQGKINPNSPQAVQDEQLRKIIQEALVTASDQAAPGPVVGTIKLGGG